jgi:hypothetical protein
MNRLIFYATVFLSTLTATSVSGQRTVTGRLVDKETGKPVKDASVTQIGTEIKTTSNALGFFQLQVDSIASIEIEAAGYQLLQFELPNVNSFKVELQKISSNSKPTEEIFYVIEEPASFPGGLAKFYSYISKNMKVPQEVKSGKVSGKVMVEFVIDTSGQIPPDDIKIRQGLCPACDAEAIRLIKESPKWNPGLQRGKPVRQRMLVPIMFE